MKSEGPGPVILAAGLTPAWQQILVFDSLKVGEVNRASEAHWCASGKVLNVALALHYLGAPGFNVTVVGGVQGKIMDDEFEALGIPRRWVRSHNPTRACTTLLDRSGGATTELVQNAAPVQAEELEEFLKVYEAEVDRAGIAVLIGSLPAGTAKTFYRDLMERTRAPVVLDASGPELLAALPVKPLCVKPNREELGRTLGRNLVSDDDLKEAMKQVNTMGAEWVVVSQGEKPLWASSRGRIYVFHPPKIQATNPIASGDCLSAGIAWGLFGGLNMLEAIRLGVAAGVENAETLLPARLNPDRVRARIAEVSMESL